MEHSYRKTSFPSFRDEAAAANVSQNNKDALNVLKNEDVFAIFKGLFILFGLLNLFSSHFDSLISHQVRNRCFCSRKQVLQIQV